MRISQDLRDYAVKHGLDESAAREQGMREKAQEFADSGGELYVERN
jgi:phosphomethylpyrimidine synthase